MAKLRRSSGRPSPAAKAKAAVPAARSKARPAVKKPAPKPAKAASKPPAKTKTPPSAKRHVRPVPQIPARPTPRAKPKPPAPPPRRSTYADAVLLYERGLQALQAKRYREAADTLKRVIVEFPEEIELHERAQLYIRVCERQITPPDSTPKTPEEQVYAATLAINAGDADRAISLLSAALQQQPDNDGAEYMLGVALAGKGDTQGALQHLARALELNPDLRDAMRKDADLEVLSETDEFQALVASAAAAPRKDRRPQPRAKR